MEPVSNGNDILDLVSLLSSEERDFLIRNNGDQVKITDLAGKIVGLYFSGSWCGPCHRFTPKLVEAYEELSTKGDFEVVFISSDRIDEAFEAYFATMPWLAIPYSDSEKGKQLKELFKVKGIPHLVIVNGDGKVLSHQGGAIIKDFGSEAYPFTPERVNALREEEEAMMKKPSLSSILVSRSRDFVISSNGDEVPISELEGKMVGLYFAMNSHRGSTEFTPKLMDLYQKVKEKGDGFEIVYIPLDTEQESFEQGFCTMPWLSLPFNDKICDKLVRRFKLRAIPTLIIIGSDGKILAPNVTEFVEEHGFEAYPFSPEKFAELAEIEKAKLESQTLESILVLGENDFVIDKSGSKVPVSKLVGKTILLYFSAEWCPPCRAFLPKLIETYHEIKAKDADFEVIFVSSDRDQATFDKFFATMPWLALPLGDKRKPVLQRCFKIKGIPAVVAIGPSGKMLSTQARQYIQAHGASAYPFTEERVKKLEEELEEKAKGWPDKIKHEAHPQHELIKTRRTGYGCDSCREMGRGWSFYCDKCDFDLHPKCAIKENEKGGWVCDGDVCRKV